MLIQMEIKSIEVWLCASTPRLIMQYKVFHGGRGSKGVEDEPVGDIITPLKSECDFRGVVNLVICSELQPNDIMKDSRQLTNY